MAFRSLVRALPLARSAAPARRLSTFRPVASTSSLPPTPATPPTDSLTLEPEVEPKLLSYFIPRSAAGGLPVYSELKNGGQRVLTVVRKVDGNIEALRQDLEQHLGAEAYTKPAARQVVLRGDWTREVKQVLGANGF